MRVRARCFWLAVALLLTACGDGPVAATGRGPVAPVPSLAGSGPSGIRGTVLLGPNCPMATEDDDPCVTPYVATLVLTGAEGEVVARTQSAADGRFEFLVPPGEYTIVPDAGDPFPQAQPIDLTVDSGVITEVQINYDTGNR